MAIVDGDDVTLLSRDGADITRNFPEITAALPGQLRQRRVILDGEIVALDDDGAAAALPCWIDDPRLVKFDEAAPNSSGKSNTKNI